MYLITEEYKRCNKFGITLLEIVRPRTQTFEFDSAEDLYNFKQYLNQLQEVKELFD